MKESHFGVEMVLGMLAGTGQKKNPWELFICRWKIPLKRKSIKTQVQNINSVSHCVIALLKALLKNKQLNKYDLTNNVPQVLSCTILSCKYIIVHKSVIYDDLKSMHLRFAAFVGNLYFYLSILWKSLTISRWEEWVRCFSGHEKVRGKSCPQASCRQSNWQSDRHAIIPHSACSSAYKVDIFWNRKKRRPRFIRCQCFYLNHIWIQFGKQYCIV